MKGRINALITLVTLGLLACWVVAQDAAENKFYPMAAPQADENWETHTGLWACPFYGDDAFIVLPLSTRTYATKESVTDGVALRVEIRKGTTGAITYENAAFPPNTAGMTLYVKGSDKCEMIVCGKVKFNVTKEWRKIDLPWEQFFTTREKPEIGWQWDARLTAPAPKDLWVILDRVGCEGPAFIMKPAIQPTVGPDETLNTQAIVGNAEILAPTLQRLKSKQPFKIVAFGDSVTAGAQVSRGNWNIKGDAANGLLFFSHLARLLNQRYGYEGVTWVQKGHGGWTADKARGVVEQDVVAVAAPEDVVIIEFGANDLSWANRTVDQWAADLKALIAAAKTKTSQIVITSPTNIGIESKKAEEASRRLREIAVSERLAFVDVSKWSLYRGVKFGWAYEANSGHPSLMGHVMIAEIMETLLGAPSFDWPPDLNRK
jgi:lysophospholipase L1-like esterase